jgi:hypothetical protein
MIVFFLSVFFVFTATHAEEEAPLSPETPLAESSTNNQSKSTVSPVALVAVADTAPTALSVVGGVLMIAGAGTAAGTSIAASRADADQQTPLLAAAAGGACLFVAGAVLVWIDP